MEVPRASQFSDDDDNDNESTVSSPGHRRSLLRSSSWSAWAARIPSKILHNTKGKQLPRPFRQRRSDKRSVTFEDSEPPPIYQEPAPGEFQGHVRTPSEENSRTSINEPHGNAIGGTVRVAGHRMRTVSQEDYLLARGANPRTGIISPSIITPGHSPEHSVDGGGTLQARAAAGESKWRQSGDQWISLGVDQPTPTGSPPKLDASAVTLTQHKIQRKPVGSPPRRNSDDRQRSSSAPTPRKFKRLELKDVDIGIPAVPENPFLGQTKEQRVSAVPATGLRCPPMNSIPSQSPLSNQTRMRVSRADHALPPIHMQNSSGPRTSDPSYPHLRYQRPEIPRRHYHLIQDMRTGDRTASNPKHVRGQREIRIVHPPFQPRSLRGIVSDPREMVAQKCSRQQDLDNNTYHPRPSTTSTSIGTRTPSSTSNNLFQDMGIPSKNMSFPMKRTKLWEAVRPHMRGRSEEMTGVLKVSQLTPEWHQSSQIGTRNGATSASITPEVDPGMNFCLPQKNKRFHRVSAEDKPRSMLGFIRAFDGPVEGEIAMNEDTVPDSPGYAVSTARRAMGHVDYAVGLYEQTERRADPVGKDSSRCATTALEQAASSRQRVRDFSESLSARLETVAKENPERAITTLRRATSFRNHMVGLEESAVAYLEPLLIGFCRRLAQMGSCIVATLRKVLRVTYTYSETGKMEIDGMLVVDVLRSVIYMLILGAIAVALAKAIGLVVRVGACIVWVFRGVFWVLM